MGQGLEHGRGVVLLRGLPVERYSEDDLRRLYWGLGTHLGTARYQNAQGELIGEVRDEVRAYGAVQEIKPAAAGEAPTSRYKARSSGPLRFHTDRVDVVALLCVRAAASGGTSKVVQLGGRPQRDPRAPARSARAALRRLLPHAPGRGGRW